MYWVVDLGLHFHYLPLPSFSKKSLLSSNVCAFEMYSLSPKSEASSPEIFLGGEMIREAFFLVKNI